MLAFQAVIVTVFAFIFALMPNISSAFLIMSTLTAQTYLLMYILMFIAVIKLRYSQPNTKRPYKIPGGNLGIWLVGGLGFIASIVVFGLGLFPPSQIPVGSPWTYEAIIVGAIVIMCLPPFIIYKFKKPSWKAKK